ncbi:MAG: hypothetical protein AAFY71_19590 [Bacteroidota bacterium]
MRDKSAFWSGVSRDTPFSGMSISWLDLLGKGLINNPLFLGSITNSEGINRMQLHIEILDEDGLIKQSGEFAKINMDIIQIEKSSEGGAKRKKYKRDKRYSNYGFVREGKDYKTLRDALDKLDEVFLPSRIIGQQAFYTIIENTLRNIKHYRSVIEEIRETGIRLFVSIQPTKFYELTEEDRLHLGKESKLYKVGVWLHHKQQLRRGKFMIIPNQWEKVQMRVVTKDGKPRLGGSFQDKVCAAMLLNNTFTSVDEFDSKKAKWHYQPYIFPASEPYSEPVERFKPDFKINNSFFDPLHNKELRPYWKNLFHFSNGNGDNINNWRKKFVLEKEKYGHSIENQENSGLVKKFFHVWISEKCQVVDTKDSIITALPSRDNLSRFQIMIITANSEKEFYEKKKELRHQGIVRIIQFDKTINNLVDDPSKKKELFNYAMLKWLHSWINVDKSGKFLGLKFRKVGYNDENTPDLEKEWIGTAWLGGKNKMHPGYLNFEQIEKIITSKDKWEDHGITEEDFVAWQEIVLNHSDRETKKGSLSIRSHTSLMSDLFRGDYIFKMDGANIDRDRDINYAQFGEGNLPFENLYRIVEIVKTSIVMLDNRIYSRLPQTHKKKKYNQFDLLRKYLKISTYEEDHDIFRLDEKKEVRKNLLDGTNFLVMHLSMIEALFDDHGRKYSEERLLDFYNKEIKEFYEKNISLDFPDNFMFVITSGRGNDVWIKELKETENHQIASQISFRPIEDLVNAIEDGLSHDDDFQIKYNLCKVFYGS